MRNKKALQNQSILTLAGVAVFLLFLWLTTKYPDRVWLFLPISLAGLATTVISYILYLAAAKRRVEEFRAKEEQVPAFRETEEYRQDKIAVGLMELELKRLKRRVKIGVTTVIEMMVLGFILNKLLGVEFMTAVIIAGVISVGLYVITVNQKTDEEE